MFDWVLNALLYTIYMIQPKAKLLVLKENNGFENILSIFIVRTIPISSQCNLSLHPENVRKSYGFLMFSGGKGAVGINRLTLRK